MTQIWLDCDGVLADFDEGFKNHTGRITKEFEKEFGTTVFWNTIKQKGDFFESLPMMQDAMFLVNNVRHLRPIILTGCPEGTWAQVQKINWAARYLPGIPIVTCLSRDKRNFCHAGDVLIDDTLNYSGLWEDEGGVFIHHTSAGESVWRLEEHLRGSS